MYRPNTGILMLKFWRHVMLQSSILCLCVTTINAKCERITAPTTATSPCEEALGDEIVHHPACSTMDFSKQSMPCELVQSVDYEALRSAGYNIVPNIPVSCEWTHWHLSNVEVILQLHFSNLFDELIYVMAWCRQTPVHAPVLTQIYVAIYVVIKPHWVQGPFSLI